MKAEKQTETLRRSNVRPGSVEGVIVVNGRPQVERADMPLMFSFDTIEELRRFCEAMKDKSCQ